MKKAINYFTDYDFYSDMFEDVVPVKGRWLEECSVHSGKMFNCRDSERDYQFHRDYKDRPAVIHLDKSGNVVGLMWVRNNQLHRLTGPAEIILQDNEWLLFYHVNGNHITGEERCLFNHEEGRVFLTLKYGK